jgi:dTDP-4-dehydrorhamnose 3,5-epimerase
MIFTPLEIAGAYLIDIEPIVDARGFFARTWCHAEFAQRGLPGEWPQSNIAWSAQRGTLRGLHFVDAEDEAKLVRCTSGAAFAVAVDIRTNSPSHGRWCGIELSSENHRMLYVPPHCAQGYQTLLDRTELLYQMSASFAAGTTRGVRYDDPGFQIRWPLEVTCISLADRTWPLYSAPSVPAAHQPSLATS